jgi:hypothetical protein
MPLSEHEQRLLEQMERQLYADDPKLASTLRGSGRSLRHRVVLGIIGIVLGLALLVSGVASQLWILGVAGFLVMLAGGWWASSGWHSGGGASPGASRPAAGGGSSPRKSGFMSRFEERWERRRDGDL